LVLRLLASFALLAPVLFALPSPSSQVKRGKSMGTVIASPRQPSVSSPIIRSKSDPFKAPADALKHLCKLLVIKRQPVRRLNSAKVVAELLDANTPANDLKSM
jgi:hypothetical protein